MRQYLSLSENLPNMGKSYSVYLQDVRAVLEQWLDKSHLGILRIVYLIVLANVAKTLWTKHQTMNPVVHALVTIGKQSLPVFFAGTILSFAGGIVIYQYNQNILAVALVNLMGIFLLWHVAKLANWAKTDMHKLIDSAHASDHQARSITLNQH